MYPGDPRDYPATTFLSLINALIGFSNARGISNVRRSRVYELAFYNSANLQPRPVSPRKSSGHALIASFIDSERARNTIPRCGFDRITERRCKLSVRKHPILPIDLVRGGFTYHVMLFVFLLLISLFLLELWRLIRCNCFLLIVAFCLLFFSFRFLFLTRRDSRFRSDMRDRGDASSAPEIARRP